MKKACRSGDIKTITEIVKYCSTSAIDKGLSGACEGGHKNLVDFLITKGADNWNSGLRGACLSGHRDLVDLMISKGADWWNGGLYGACKGGHLELAELMVSHGADYMDSENFKKYIDDKKELIHNIVGQDIGSLVTKYLWP